MNNNQPKQINQNRLVRIFKDIKRLDSSENRFCFLIGAGASKSSGIKTGWELSVDWYNDLKKDLSEKERLEWEKEIGFKEDKIGEFYSFLYRKRYETSPQLGYDEFKKIMEPIEPGLGYVILSQILANEKHNFVITTNFDYLIEDAVRMYTSTKPFSAGHETLAEFISSQTERPTIIKVHRDLFLHPFNDENETDKLKEEWERALKPILKNFSLLVIGYGGNDGSLMDYLNNIKAEDRKPIYWCVREDSKLNSRIDELLTEKDFIVKISGFDELMFDLNRALGYKIFEKLDDSNNHPFVEASKKRISSLNEKLKALLDKLQKDEQKVSKAAKGIFTGAMKVILDAYSETNIDKREKIYKKGVAMYPNDANLMGSYADFLEDIRKDYDKAEEYYKQTIKLDTKDADFVGNYALFLKNIRKDYDKAEEYYQQALELDPKHANNIGNYANFLKNIRKDYDKAEEYYQQALELDPKHANTIGNYANFLSDIRKDYDKAEEYYKQAIKLEPKHANTIGNYALFLKNIRKDYDEAEEYYKQAIKLEPKHANTIGNYALFLENIRKDYDKAEEYYKQAIKLDPKHANTIGNYANFLFDIRKDYDKAEEYYKQAIKLEPKHANTIGNYALFLENIRKDYDKAEEYYKQAIELDPKDADFIGNYANFLFDIRKDYDKAEEYYKQAIKLDPKHANNIGNYANFLKNIRKDYDKAEEYYQQALELDPKHANTIGNYANFLSDIRKDYDKAEEYYQQALELDPKHANNIGNYAHHIIVSKQDFENAETYIDKAFELADDNHLVLLAELWFYRYAHYSKWQEIGEKELNKLISKGAKSIGWNFQSHIKIARDNKTSDIQKLEQFAKLIAE